MHTLLRTHAHAYMWMNAVPNLHTLVHGRVYTLAVIHVHYTHAYTQAHT